ncbi:MAG: ComF family protein [Helicobacteraceae bacterium]|jgi:competence protein ComFC|nr:ComF family protein [Helicobacteraceae bacterium]
MRCLLCEKLSWRYICPECDRSIDVRARIHNLRELKAITFYEFGDIEPLIKTKYYPFGSFVLKYLAIKAFKPFFSELKLDESAALVPIDDRLNAWYSHSALLAKAGAAGMIAPRFGSLRARSKEKYAGQTLAFRKSHPRRFIVKPFPETNAIILDDLITTGTTLLEAAAALEKRDKNPLFAVALARAD